MAKPGDRCPHAATALVSLEEISSSDIARSFIHLRRNVHLTAISASKMVTGMARSVTGAPAGFLAMMYLHLRR